MSGILQRCSIQTFLRHKKNNVVVVASCRQITYGTSELCITPLNNNSLNFKYVPVTHQNQIIKRPYSGLNESKNV